MATEAELAKLMESGKTAFQDGSYESAAGTFQNAAKGYAAQGDSLSEAEAKNNMSVALLQAGKSKQALEAVLGTDRVFEAAHDLRRQGMAVGNEGAALEALKRTDEALAAYDRAAVILAQAGERDMLSMVKKSAAAIRLKRGQFGESAANMIGSLEAKEKPSLFDRILKFLVRLKPW